MHSCSDAIQWVECTLTKAGQQVQVWRRYYYYYYHYCYVYYVYVYYYQRLQVWRGAGWPGRQKPRLHRQQAWPSATSLTPAPCQHQSLSQDSHSRSPASSRPCPPATNSIAAPKQQQRLSQHNCSSFSSSLRTPVTAAPQRALSVQIWLTANPLGMRTSWALLALTLQLP